jgi:hypothetical protein
MQENLTGAVHPTISKYIVSLVTRRSELTSRYIHTLCLFATKYWQTLLTVLFGLPLFGRPYATGCTYVWIKQRHVQCNAALWFEYSRDSYQNGMIWRSSIIHTMAIKSCALNRFIDHQSTKIFLLRWPKPLRSSTWTIFYLWFGLWLQRSCMLNREICK